MARDDYLFIKGDASSSLENHGREVEKRISELSDGAIRARSQKELVESLLEDELVRPLVIDEENVRKHLEEAEVEISGDRYFQDRPSRRVVAGYKFTCEYPYSGDSVLWDLRPNRWSTVLPRAKVSSDRGGRDGILVISTTASGTPTPEQLLAGIEEELRTIRQYVEWQAPQVREFNESLERRIRAAVENRFSRLGSGNDLASALGAAVRSTSDKGGSLIQNPVGRKVHASAAPKTPVKRPPHDVFISHASEDKGSIVRPLAEALRARGVDVWLDETELSLGDSLRRTIDRGLAESTVGLVILSPRFFAKSWPQYELDGLVAREIQGAKVILPVWHEITHQEVARYSPTLADKLAADTSRHSVDEIAEQVLSALNKLRKPA